MALFVGGSLPLVDQPAPLVEHPIVTMARMLASATPALAGPPAPGKTLPGPFPPSSSSVHGSSVGGTQRSPGGTSKSGFGRPSSSVSGSNVGGNQRSPGGTSKSGFGRPGSSVSGSSVAGNRNDTNAPPKKTPPPKTTPTTKTKRSAPPADTQTTIQTQSDAASGYGPPPKTGGKKTTTTTTPPTYPVDDPYAGILKYLQGLDLSIPDQSGRAAALTDAAIKQQVAALALQKAQTQQQGVTMAEAVQAAANAVAGLQKNAPAGLQAAYGNAGQDIANIASGFGQGYGAQGQQETNAVNALGGAVGGPQVGPLFNSGAIGNAIGYQQGQLPSKALTSQGLAANVGSAPGPKGSNRPGVGGQFIGQGRQEALLAMGASNQAANAINQQINQAYAQRPTLLSQYLSSLTSNASAANDAKIKLATLALAAGHDVGTFNLGKAKLGEQTAADLAASRSANVRAAETIRHDTAMEIIGNFNANTSRLKLSGKTPAQTQKDMVGISNDISQAVHGGGKWVLKGTNKDGSKVYGYTIPPKQSPYFAFMWLQQRYPAYLANPNTPAAQMILQQIKQAYGIPSVPDSVAFAPPGAVNNLAANPLFPFG